MSRQFCSYCMTAVDEESPCPVCGLTAGAYTPAPHHLPPGTVLNGRYLVGRVLGEGGFGITYIGCDLQLELKVAIKEYFPTDKANRVSEASLSVSNYSGSAGVKYEEGKSRFLQEARSMARMDKQPVIVTVRDFFETNNTAYIVMEYVEGTTLKELVEQKGGRIPADELFQTLEPLFSALNAMHGVGLIHRDISPENLMLERGMIRLLDFGCARESVDGNATMTIALKHGYAPVEQYQNKGQGPWTDVYALSATIYYCLTGKKPPQAMDRLCEDELILPRKLGVPLTEQQEKALLCGMSIRPRRRFRTMEELHAALYTETASFPETDLSPTMQTELTQTQLFSGGETPENQEEMNQAVEPDAKPNKIQIGKYLPVLIPVLALLAILLVPKGGSSGDISQPGGEQVSAGAAVSLPEDDVSQFDDFSDAFLVSQMENPNIDTVVIPSGTTVNVADELTIYKPVVVELGAYLNLWNTVCLTEGGSLTVEGDLEVQYPLNLQDGTQLILSPSANLRNYGVIEVWPEASMTVEEGCGLELWSGLVFYHSSFQKVSVPANWADHGGILLDLGGEHQINVYSQQEFDAALSDDHYTAIGIVDTSVTIPANTTLTKSILLEHGSRLTLEGGDLTLCGQDVYMASWGGILDLNGGTLILEDGAVVSGHGNGGQMAVNGSGIRLGHNNRMYSADPGMLPEGACLEISGASDWVTPWGVDLSGVTLTIEDNSYVMAHRQFRLDDCDVSVSSDSSLDLWGAELNLDKQSTLTSAGFFGWNGEDDAQIDGNITLRPGSETHIHSYTTLNGTLLNQGAIYTTGEIVANGTLDNQGTIELYEEWASIRGNLVGNQPIYTGLTWEEWMTSDENTPNSDSYLWQQMADDRIDTVVIPSGTTTSVEIRDFFSISKPVLVEEGARLELNCDGEITAGASLTVEGNLVVIGQMNVLDDAQLDITSGAIFEHYGIIDVYPGADVNLAEGSELYVSEGVFYHHEGTNSISVPSYWEEQGGRLLTMTGPNHTYVRSQAEFDAALANDACTSIGLVGANVTLPADTELTKSLLLELGSRLTLEGGDLTVSGDQTLLYVYGGTLDLNGGKLILTDQAVYTGKSAEPINASGIVIQHGAQMFSSDPGYLPADSIMEVKGAWWNALWDVTLNGVTLDIQESCIKVCDTMELNHCQVELTKDTCVTDWGTLNIGEGTQIRCDGVLDISGSTRDTMAGDITILPEGVMMVHSLLELSGSVTNQGRMFSTAEIALSGTLDNQGRFDFYGDARITGKGYTGNEPVYVNRIWPGDIPA